MWHVKKVEFYVVTNGVITTEVHHTYLEDAQQELAELLEGLEEIAAHEKLVLPERLPLRN